MLAPVRTAANPTSRVLPVPTTPLVAVKAMPRFVDVLQAIALVVAVQRVRSSRWREPKRLRASAVETTLLVSVPVDSVLAAVVPSRGRNGGLIICLSSSFY